MPYLHTGIPIYSHADIYLCMYYAYYAKLCQRSPTARSGALMRLKMDNLMRISQPTLIAYAHFVLLLYVVFSLLG